MQEKSAPTSHRLFLIRTFTFLFTARCATAPYSIERRATKRVCNRVRVNLPFSNLSARFSILVLSRAFHVSPFSFPRSLFFVVSREERGAATE